MEGIGIFKSQQVIYKEILAKAGNIREKHLELATDEIREGYNSGATSYEIKQMEDVMRSEIEKMVRADYSQEIEKNKMFFEQTIADAQAAI